MNTSRRDRRRSTGNINQNEKSDESMQRIIAILDQMKSGTPIATRPAPPPPIRRTLSSRSLNVQAPSKERQLPPKSKAGESSAAEGIEDNAGDPMLKSLKEANISIVGQTIDFENLGIYPFEGTSLNAFLLSRGTRHEDSQYHIRTAIEYVVKENPDCDDLDHLLNLVSERYRVELGMAMIDRIPGPHYTFVDTSLHDDCNAMVEQACRLVSLFEKQGVNRQRVVVSIPANNDGIRAAKRLEAESFIRVNLIMVSSVTHAAICLESGASSISFCHETLIKGFDSMASYGLMSATGGGKMNKSDKEDAATEIIRTTAAYLRHNKVATQILVSNAKFRHLHLLRDIDGIFLRQRESMQAVSTTVKMLPSPDRISVVYQRAQLMKYPTNYLENGDNFVPAMPTRQERFLAQRTLGDGLRRATWDLEATRAIIREQLQHRRFVNSLDATQLTGMYFEDVRQQYEYDIAVAQTAAVGASVVAIPQPDTRRNDIGYRMYWIVWDE